MEHLARERRAGRDPAIRQRITEAHIAEQALSMLMQRARARAAGGTAGPESSVTKIAKASTNQSLQELAMQLRGADATAWEADDADAADWVSQFLRTRANSIEGGTSEIQRNVIGERVLGLPREPDPHKGQPWRSVPRS